MVIPMELLPEAAVVEEPAPVPPGFPSGDMETRAARLPGGGATGAAGPGLDERAMKVPLDAVAAMAGSSGADAGWPSWVLDARRGATPAFTINFGFAGPAADAARLSSAVRCS